MRSRIPTTGTGRHRGTGSSSSTASSPVRGSARCVLDAVTPRSRCSIAVGRRRVAAAHEYARFLGRELDLRAATVGDSEPHQGALKRAARKFLDALDPAPRAGRRRAGPGAAWTYLPGPDGQGRGDLAMPPAAGWTDLPASTLGDMGRPAP